MFGRSVCAVAAILLASGGAIPEVTQQSGRIPQFENSEVKVWKSLVVPNGPLTLHRHDHPRVLVALTDGEMKLIEQSGKTQENHWKAGNAYWLPANPPGTLHSDVNAGDKAIEVLVVELKNAR